MQQQLGFIKTGLLINTVAAIGCVVLLLSFGGIAVTSNFGGAQIAFWYTVASSVIVLSLLGKLICRLGPDWFGSTTVLLASIVLDMFLGATIVCFCFGITVPNFEEQVHHSATAILFVASTFCFIRWLSMATENAGAIDGQKNTKRAGWFFNAALISAIGITVAIAIDSNVKSVTGIIANVLIVFCIIMFAGCLVFKIAALLGLLRQMSRS